MQLDEALRWGGTLWDRESTSASLRNLSHDARCMDGVMLLGSSNNWVVGACQVSARSCRECGTGRSRVCMISH